MAQLLTIKNFNMKKLLYALSFVMVFLIGYKVGSYGPQQTENLILIDNPTDSEVEFDDMTPISAKCEATTKKGKKCTRKAKNGLFCTQHAK